MSTGPRVVSTEAGPLTLVPLHPLTLAALGRLFPRVGFMRAEWGEMLALATSHEARALTGLRVGYGWYEAQHAGVAQQVAMIERLRLPHMLAAYAERGFRGVLAVASCVAGVEGADVQQGELVFVHLDAPLESGVGSRPLATYETLFGEGASDAMLTCVADLGEAWKGAGLPERVLTDLEPCRAHDENVRWWADLVLVDSRVLLVRPEVRDDDVVLAEVVRAGFTEVEWVPSSFVVLPPQGEGAAPPAPGA